MATNLFDDTLEQLPPVRPTVEPPPPPEDPIAAAVDRVLARGRGKQEDALRRAIDTTPDREAEVRRLAESEGLPSSVVERNFDAIKKNHTLRSAPFEKLGKETPKLAKWFENPSNMALAQDDIEPLMSLETVLRVGKNIPRAMAAGVNRIDASVFGAAQFVAEAAFLDGVAAQAKTLRQAATSRADIARGQQEGAGALEKAFYGGWESVVVSAPGMALSVMSGGSAVPALLTMGALTGGEAFGQARDKGKGFGESTQFAGGQAGVEVFTEMIPAKWFLADLAKNAPFLKVLMRQGLAEIPGEQIATLLQDFNEWAVLNTDKPFQSYLDERPSAAAATLVATITSVGAQTSFAKAIQSITKDGGRAHQAKQDDKFFTDLGQAARSVKTLERDPKAVEDLVQQMGNEPLHAPVEAFITFWQDKKLETPTGVVEGVDEIAAVLTGRPDALKIARESNEDLEIPMASYVTRVAATPFHAEFSEHLRREPEGETKAERRAFIEAEAAKATEPVEEPVEEPVDQVRQQILTKLQTSLGGGAVTLPQEAIESYADLFESIVPTVAGRENLDPATVLRDYGMLDVFGPTEQAPAAGEQLLQKEPVTSAPLSPDEIDALVAEVEALHRRFDPDDRDGFDSILGTATEDLTASDIEEIQIEHRRLREMADKSAALQRWRDPTGEPPVAAPSAEAISTYHALRHAGFDVPPPEGYVDTPATETTEAYAGPERRDTTFTPEAQRQRMVELSKDPAAVAGGRALMRRLSDINSSRVEEPKGRDDAAGGATTLYQEEAAEDEEDEGPRIADFNAAPGRTQNERFILSTRVPSGPKAIKQSDVLTTTLSVALSAPGDFLKRVGAVLRKTLPSGAPAFPQITDNERKTLSDVETIERLVDVMVGDLRWLWEQAAPWRERAKRWYVGAHRISLEMADEFGISAKQSAAVLAALSPQMDWFKNVDLAYRVARIWRQSNQDNPVFDEAKFESYAKRTRESEGGSTRGSKDVIERGIAANKARFLGKAWSEMDVLGQAILLREIDEASGDRSYRIVNPEGTFGDLKRNKPSPAQAKRGQPGDSSDVGWGTYKYISNAISVLHDGSEQNIHVTIGYKHKVRSFFNNISDPNYAGAVTIDTHAVAANTLLPLAGSSYQVIQTMNGPGSKATGLKGINFVMAEAYFRLGRELGVLPREVQSVTWEAVRGLFKPDQKRGSAGAALRTKVDALWAERSSGKISGDEFRTRLLAEAGGIRPPDWFDLGGEAAGDQGSLPAGDARVRDDSDAAGRGTDGGSAGGRPGRVAGGRDRLHTGRWREKATQPEAENASAVEPAPQPTALPTTLYQDLYPELVPADTHTRADSGVTPEAFIEARNKSTRGGFLAPLAAEDLQDAKLYLAHDGKVGGALQPDGDMGNVFNNGGPKGAAAEVLLQMIEDGGLTLDAFDHYLPTLYANFGLVEVGRMKFNREFAPPGWNYERDGEPDVVFMALGQDVGTADEIRARVYGPREGWTRNVETTTYYEDYDAARAAATAHARRAVDSRRSSAQQGAGLRGEVGREHPGAGEGDRRPLTLYQEEKEKRGAITFGPPVYKGGKQQPRQFSIKLFETADVTTFLHESAHFFYEMMQDLERRPESSQALRTDLETLREWHRAKDPNWDGVISREQHEQFANGFVAWLAEGNAPSRKLNGVFARFRTWLLRFAGELRKHDVQLTDDVRRVFARMVASDVAIEDAQAAVKATPMFLSADQAGMTPEAFVAYQSKIEEATQKGRQKLEQRLLSDLRKQQTARYREARATIRGEVEQEIYQVPVYQALAAIRRGTQPDGTPLPEGAGQLKLSKQAIVARYGEARLAALPKGVTVSKDGLDPDTVAPMFGIDSGDALLSAMIEADPMEQVIKLETERRLKAQEGDLILDNQLSNEARAALANEHREEIIQMELRALRKMQRTVKPFVVAGQREVRKEQDYERRWFEAEAKLRVAVAQGYKQVEIDALEREVAEMKRQARTGPGTIYAGIPSQATLREAANERIARTPVRHIRPEVFWQASRKASQLALDAAARQDFPAAIEAKTQELISLSLYREANRVLEDVDARVRAAQALTTPASRKRMGLAGGSYQEQIDDILERYQFAAIPNTRITKRQKLREWVEALQADGMAVELPEEMLDDARRIHYKELTVGDLVNVTDGLRQIVHLARLKLGLLKNKDQREFAAVRDAVATSIYEHGTVREALLEYRPKDERKRSWGEFFAIHARMSTLAQVMDGNDVGGAVWSALARPANDAAAEKHARNVQVGTDYGAIIRRHYTASDLAKLGDKQHIPALGKSLSKEARLAVALNWGNETSRDRIRTDPKRKWTPQQIDAILDTLDERDWRFVVDTWRYLDTFWPEIAAKTKRLTGVEPERVEGVPVVTKFGTFDGGYYPLVGDSRFNAKTKQWEALTEAQLKTNAAYVSQTTKRGHLETRQAHATYSVKLDLGVVFGHLDQVVHDLTHHEMLIDTTRLLRDPAIANAIISTRGDVIYDQFVNAFEAIAAGKMTPAKNGVEAFANFMRTGTQVALLGYSFWTGIQQPLGLFNGAADVGPRWVARGLVRWLGRPGSMVQTVKWINEVSPFMASRATTQTQDLMELRGALKLADGWFDTMVRTVTGDTVTQQGILDSFLWHLGVMQRVADVPTWLGQFEKSMAAGETEARAIAIADQAIINSQGSGRVTDLAQVQRGAPTARLFMTFYSYGSATYNAAYLKAGRTDFKSATSVAKFLGGVSLIYVFPSMATLMLRELTGKGGDDDDDEGLGQYMIDVGQESLAAALNGMVFARELAQLAGDGTRGYAGPAGSRLFQLAFNAKAQAAQMEPDEAFFKSINAVGGVLARYPSAQLERTVLGWMALEEGETSNPAALLFGPPKRAN